MDLVIGRGAVDRERGSFPPWRQENCLLEPSPVDPKGYNLLSRPPLISVFAWGSGPVHGIYQRDGLFGGNTFALIGDTLYQDGTALGTIDGTGPVSWAGGNGELVLARGASAYSFNGANLQAIAFPDGAQVRAVAWMARRFAYVRKGGGRFYWSELDDGRTIDGLNYANAESEPDELYDIQKQGDVLLLLGSSSIECWILTGDPDLPWSRIVQRTYNRGVFDTGCAQEINGAVYVVAADGTVCIAGDGLVPISDASLEEKIRNSTSVLTFWYRYEGKSLLCVRLDVGSYVLDLTLDNQPVKFSTALRDHWAPKCAVNIGDEPHFGDDTSGVIWRFHEGSTTDSAVDQFTRVFTAGLPVAGQPISIFNVIVGGNNGSAQVLAGSASDPILEMRFSRDGGREWLPWKASRWGLMGEFLRRARFGSCGMIGSPGLLAEFRMNECAPLRVESVRANETMAGRGR
jgi:hypothetical protein